MNPEHFRTSSSCICNLFFSTWLTDSRSSTGVESIALHKGGSDHDDGGLAIAGWARIYDDDDDELEADSSSFGLRENYGGKTSGNDISRQKRGAGLGFRLVISDVRDGEAEEGEDGEPKMLSHRRLHLKEVSL
ncbi:unnamed protein product, partial [Linum tenue]